MESYKEYIERCAENCNCNGEAFTSNQGIVLAKKLAEKLDECGVFTFTFTVDVENHTWTADKTYEEIVNAVKTGKPAFGISAGSYFSAFYFASYRRLQLMSSGFSVNTVGENATGTINYNCFILNSDGSIETFMFSNDVSGMGI